MLVLQSKVAVQLAFLGSILSIVFINVVLSGDNAVVIAMASRRLRPRERKRAIMAGGAGAIVLRVLFTAAASLLLNVPFLQLAGGILLVVVAYRLLGDDVVEQHVEAAADLWGAVQSIIAADFLMSLDNVLAVAGASRESFALLLFGLATSMPVVLLGSSLIARLMDRHGWLSIAGALVLTVTSARMVADDRLLAGALRGSQHAVAIVALSIAFSLAAVAPSLRHRHL